MTNQIDFKNNRDLMNEKLIRQNQNALAKLINSLDSTQYKLLTRYIRTSDKLRHHEFVNMALLFKQNKKG